MNMRTRVERVMTANHEEINTKIREMERKVWYLRGTPQFSFYENKCVAFMTFETPEDEEWNPDDCHPDVPRTPKELFDSIGR